MPTSLEETLTIKSDHTGSFLSKLDENSLSGDLLDTDDDDDDEFACVTLSDEEDSTSLDDSSSIDSFDSSYISSDDEDTFLSIHEEEQMTHAMRRSVSAPVLDAMTMSAMQVSVLLNQMKLNHAAANTRPVPATAATSNRNASFSSQPAQSVIGSATKGHLLRHIQGEAMPRMRSFRRSSIGSCQSNDTSHQSTGEGATAAADEQPTDPSPLQVLETILTDANLDFRTFSPQDVPCGFFQEISEERMDAYNADVIAAIRASDVEELRRFWGCDGRRLDGCNRFGESVLHTACRRGKPAVMRFLVEEAKVDLRVRDDYGRSPMHDACWTVNPNMELISIMLRQWPDLLLIRDKRGFTPLHYVRSGQWGLWKTYLEENREYLIPKVLLRLPVVVDRDEIEL